MELSSILDACHILENFGNTYEVWTAEELNANEELVEACQTLRTSCQNVLETLNRILIDDEVEEHSQSGSENVRSNIILNIILTHNVEYLRRMKKMLGKRPVI